MTNSSKIATSSAITAALIGLALTSARCAGPPLTSQQIQDALAKYRKTDTVFVAFVLTLSMPRGGLQRAKL